MPVLKGRDPNTGMYVPIIGGGGVTDHGALTGLGDDDHPQYHNDARGDGRYVRDTGDTMSGDLVIDRGVADYARLTTKGLYPRVNLDAIGDVAVNTYGEIAFNNHGVARFLFRAQDIDPGDNTQTGSNFYAYARKDDGTNQATVFKITRSTGRMTMYVDPVEDLGVATKRYVDAGDAGTAAQIPYFNSGGGWGAYVSGYNPYVVKLGPMVFIQGLFRRSGNLVMTAGTAYQLGTIPAGYIPSYDGPLFWATHQHSTNTAGSGGRGYIEPNGKLWLVPHYDGTILTGQWCAINGSYFL